MQYKWTEYVNNTLRTWLMYDLLFLGGYLYGKRDTTAMLQATFVLSDIGPLCMQLYGP